MYYIFVHVTSKSASIVTNTVTMVYTGQEIATVTGQCPTILSLYHIHNTLHDRSKIINVQANFMPKPN